MEGTLLPSNRNTKSGEALWSYTSQRREGGSRRIKLFTDLSLLSKSDQRSQLVLLPPLLQAGHASQSQGRRERRAIDVWLFLDVCHTPGARCHN